MGYCCRIFTPVQPVYPAAPLRDFLSGAYSLYVGNRIRHIRTLQPLEASRATAEVHRRLCYDRYQLLNRMIDRRADGAR
jgi:hypothetical protein